jgi:hypothetical protein
MLEVREVLPPIVKRFELRPAREEPERVRLFGTAIPPDKGAQVVLSLRRVGAEQADHPSERIRPAG